MKKTDLRVIKTKRRIKEVFTELLQKKDVDEISVTELSRIAEINKGTFYLHYKDIYDLYGEILQDKINDLMENITFFHEFFDAPEQFILHFLELRKKMRPIENPVFRPNNFLHAHIIPELMTGALRKKLYEENRIKQTEDNDTRLNYILFSLFHFLRASDPEKKYPIISVLIVNDIKTAFPELF